MLQELPKLSGLTANLIRFCECRYGFLGQFFWSGPALTYLSLVCSCAYSHFVGSLKWRFQHSLPHRFCDWLAVSRGEGVTRPLGSRPSRVVSSVCTEAAGLQKQGADWWQVHWGLGSELASSHFFHCLSAKAVHGPDSTLWWLKSHIACGCGL